MSLSAICYWICSPFEAKKLLNLGNDYARSQCGWMDIHREWIEQRDSRAILYFDNNYREIVLSELLSIERILAISQKAGRISRDVYQNTIDTVKGFRQVINNI